jgi:hypothetical protein
MVTGSTVLLHNHVDLGGIDSSYAFTAAGFAGALLSALLFGFLIPLHLSSILSPIWLAIIMGVLWVRVKWTEKWTGRESLVLWGTGR